MSHIQDSLLPSSSFLSIIQIKVGRYIGLVLLISCVNHNIGILRISICNAQKVGSNKDAGIMQNSARTL